METLLAADRLVDLAVLQVRSFQPQTLQHGTTRHKGRLAVIAQDAYQALGHDGQDRRGNQKGLHPDIHQAGNSAGRVVGVEGREHQVPGEGRLDGNFGSLLVADFAHQDHIGVLPHDGTQPLGKGQFDLGIDLDLADAFDLVFNRIFNGDDVDARFVDGR